MGYRQSGEGPTGRGEAETTPPPMSPASLDEHLFARPPPPPGRCRGLLPPPQGGGQCLAIVRIQCPGGRNGVSVRVFTSSRGSAHPDRDTVSMGYRPAGVGLTGRGRNAPSPVAACHWSTPASRRFQRLLPPPPEGAGECLAIAPDTGSGGRNRISVKGVHIEPRICSSWPGHCIDGISPPRGRG